jgi:hypothetical protein
MKTHRYTGPASLRVWGALVSGVVILGVFVPLGLFFFWGSLLPERSGLICVAIWFLVFGIGLGLFFLHAYPAVTVTDKELEIGFLWRKLSIPWSTVLGVKERGFPMHHIVLVYSRRITPFHILYSWYHSRVLKPGFWIANSISDYDELIRTIHRKCRDSEAQWTA